MKVGFVQPQNLINIHRQIVWQPFEKFSLTIWTKYLALFGNICGIMLTPHACWWLVDFFAKIHETRKTKYKNKMPFTVIRRAKRRKKFFRTVFITLEILIYSSVVCCGFLLMLFCRFMKSLYEKIRVVKLCRVNHIDIHGGTKIPTRDSTQLLFRCDVDRLSSWVENVIEIQLEYCIFLSDLCRRNHRKVEVTERIWHRALFFARETLFRVEEFTQCVLLRNAPSRTCHRWVFVLCFTSLWKIPRKHLLWNNEGANWA